MPQVASQAHAASGGGPANQPRQRSAGSLSEAAHIGRSTPFASLIDRAAETDSGAHADNFRAANRPAEPPRRTDDSRQHDRSRTDRKSTDRAGERRDDVRASDRRKDTKAGTRDDVARAHDDTAPVEDRTADKAGDEDTAVKPEAKSETASEAGPDADTADAADSGNAGTRDADAVATAIDSASTGKAATPAPVVTIAPAAAGETDAIALAPAETEIAIDTGKPAQPAPERAAEEAVSDPAAAKAEAKTKTGGIATETAPKETGGFDDTLGAETAHQGDGRKLHAEAKTAQGEAKPAVEAKPHHAAAADKAAEVPPPAASAGNATQGPPAHAQNSQIHVPQVQHASPVAIANAADASPVSQQAQTVPVEGLAVEIAAKAQSGKNRFEIRLDPPELGRIEVRLDVDRHGQVTSRLVVERPETLDLLRRDAAGLERALQEAGLKTTDNSLQFSLRDQTLNQQASHQSRDSAEVIVSDETLPVETVSRGYRSLASLRGGVDIRI